jgi:hypothetical protein
MKLKNIIMSTLILVIFTGCTQTNIVGLNPKAKMVREIQPDWKNKCKFLGNDQVISVNGFPRTIEVNYKNAKNTMLNTVIKQNGNAYIINDIIKNTDVEIQFEIYKCRNY